MTDMWGYLLLFLLCNLLKNLTHPLNVNIKIIIILLSNVYARFLSQLYLLPVQSFQAFLIRLSYTPILYTIQ